MRFSVKQWVLAAALLGMAAQSGAAADRATGKTLAQKLCVNCHIVAPGENAAPVTAGVPSFAAIAAKPEQTAEKVGAFILNPHPPMPEVQLTNRERGDLAAYIMSLKP